MGEIFKRPGNKIMDRYLKNRWIRWGLYILLGIAFRFLLDVVYSLFYRNYELLQPIRSYLFTLILTFLVLEGIVFVNKRLNVHVGWDKNPYKRFLYQWLFGFIVAIFFTVIVRWIILLTFFSFSYVNLLDEIIILVFDITIILLITVVDLSMFLLEKWRFSLAELERFRKENAEFRFEFLRAQVNPHFLFNSLNTLSSLIYLDQEKAELFVRELSDVYRYILEHRDQELVSLEKELEMAWSYIFLVQLRFEKNLLVNVNVDKSKEKFSVAPLTLQMLIENAIKHNIISVRKPLTIDIYTEDDNIVVKNNLQRKETPGYSSKMGIRNIRNRYGYLTDKEVLIDEKNDEFIVRIPLIEQK
ncbi:MAG: histidine kinase [Bacteroidales bacterium]|nr:histidine kinase [Bacteroidales bacterium]